MEPIFSEIKEELEKQLREIFENVFPLFKGNYKIHLAAFKNIDCNKELVITTETLTMNSQSFIDKEFINALLKDQYIISSEYLVELDEEIKGITNISSGDFSFLFEKNNELISKGLFFSELLSFNDINEAKKQYEKGASIKQIQQSFINKQCEIVRNYILDKLLKEIKINKNELFYTILKILLKNDNYFCLSKGGIYKGNIVFFIVEVNIDFYTKNINLFHQKNPYPISNNNSFIIQIIEITFDKWIEYLENLNYGLVSTTSIYIMTSNAIIDLAAEDITSGRGLPSYKIVNSISSMTYESSYCHGKVVFLMDEDNDKIHNFLSFSCGIKINYGNERFIRKLIEMTAEKDYYLVAKSNSIIGIAKVDNFSDIHILKFDGYMKWGLFFNKSELISFDKGRFNYTLNKYEQEILKISNYFRKDNLSSLVEIIELLFDQKHGAMLIVFENSKDAEDEANRLSEFQRALKVEPAYDLVTDKKMLFNISSIDGAIIMDIKGLCYGIGVIVDGEACVYGTPSRGARYNSANNYIKWKSNSCHCIGCVISEDKTIDVIIHN